MYFSAIVAVVKGITNHVLIARSRYPLSLTLSSYICSCHFSCGWGFKMLSLYSFEVGDCMRGLDVWLWYRWGIILLGVFVHSVVVFTAIVSTAAAGTAVQTCAIGDPFLSSLVVSLQNHHHRCRCQERWEPARRGDWGAKQEWRVVGTIGVATAVAAVGEKETKVRECRKAIVTTSAAWRQ